MPNVKYLIGSFRIRFKNETPFMTKVGQSGTIKQGVFVRRLGLVHESVNVGEFLRDQKY